MNLILDFVFSPFGLVGGFLLLVSFFGLSLRRDPAGYERVMKPYKGMEVYVDFGKNGIKRATVQSDPKHGSISVRVEGGKVVSVKASRLYVKI